ncbi:MAG TPA: PAS domain S-box protein, partial [Thermodesulfobacteriota bacterium]|nr:PAS domain S-box protein [Thermodesulfobacteriota bacterium]
MMKSTPREISCRITRTLLLYVREQNNGSLGPLLDGLELDEEYLLDPNNWVSHAFLHILYHRMFAILGDDNAVYKMARASERFRSLGLLDSLARLLGNPKLIYAASDKYNKLLKLNGDVHIHEMGETSVLLEDRYHDSAQKTRYDCDYTRGVLEGIPTIFEMPPAEVEEIECQVAAERYGKRAWPDTPRHGSRGCLYRVKWENVPLSKRLSSRLSVYHRVIDDLQETNRRIQAKYEEARRLALDLEAANRELLESKRQLEAKTAELAESEERYRFLAENVSDILWILSLENMKFKYISASVSRIRGFTPEEAMRLSLEEMLTPDSLKLVRAILAEELAREGKPGADPNRHRTMEVQQLCKDGSYAWAEARMSFIRSGEGRPVGVLGVTRDISKRKRAEAELKEIAEKYSTLFNTTSDGVWINDLEGRILEANDAYCRMSGYSREEILSMPISALEAVETGEEISRHIKNIIDVGHDSFESRHRRKDGSLFDVDITALYFRSDGGRIAIFTRDITDRKGMERELRKSRDELELGVQERTAEIKRQAALIGLSHDAMIATDLKSRITFWSKGAEEVYGWRREEALGRVIYELFQTKFEGPPSEVLAEIVRKGRWDGELVHTRRDGQRITVLSRQVVQRDPDGNPVGIFEINIDITERKKVEEELRHAQKMESLGTLAGGIAHDFNNLLMPVLLNADMALLDIHNGEIPSAQSMELIKASGNRGKELVRQIITFSRHKGEELKPIDISPITKETIKFLRSTLPSTVRFETHIEDPSPLIMGNPTQIHQILMNLCNNAAHAMEEDGGILAITLKKGDLREKEGMEPGSYVCLTVKDTGHGMNPEVRERAFDPFFTTKAKGKGTGMGLAVVHGIVKRHGGEIRLESEVGKGTTVTVFLPVCRQTPKEEPLSRVSGILTGRERVLFVDDEEFQAHAVEAALKRLGYRVAIETDPR